MTSQGPAPLKALVTLEHGNVVCFAMEQAGVPIVQRAVVRNAGSVPIPASILKLAIEPQFSPPILRPVPPLPPGHAHDLGLFDVPLAPGLLRRIVEAERAQVTWQLLCGDAVVAAGSSVIEILAHNEWPGGRAPAPLLAAFATPNHPAVGSLLASVSEHLQRATGANAIDGYQSKSPQRAYDQVRAAYDCIQAIGLSYAGLPPSFEQTGQKVRLPDILLRDRVGNCLDLTLFTVACLELMSLAPLIVLFKGHAIPAVWLVDDRFPEGTVADAARLRTAIALPYLVAFDSSTMVDPKRPSLEAAKEVADRLLSKDDDFQYAVDVRVARRDGFRPLSLRDGTSGPSSVDVSPHGARAYPSAQVPPQVSPPQPRGTDPIHDRFRAWKDQLLDLSLRNKLLNFRKDAKSSLPLSVPNIALFEDMLAAGKTFDVQPAAPRDKRDGRDASLQDSRIDPAQQAAELLADLKRQTVHCPLQPDELLKRGVHMDRAARGDLEEGGANTLYVAIGLLRWYESEAEDSVKLAPLLLVPVQIEYQRTTRRIRIRHIQEDSLPNHTLVEKMRADYNVDLSGLANIAPDDSGLDVPTMIRSVRDAIRHMPRWELEERACLGLFTFTKFLMWRDLDTNLDVLLQSPTVRFLASNGSTELPATEPLVEPGALDAVAPPDALPLVVDSDSSQTSAVMSALAGQSFVLQGPPGTGKSQTITNLIATALHHGKTVLFVSEKMAALEVVHRRLALVGLADFCLELHSHKAQKRGVIQSFKQALERKRSGQRAPWEERSQELAATRARLNAYVKALHRPRRIGRSFFAVTSRLLELRDAPRYAVALPNIAEWSETQHRSLLDLAGQFATSGAGIEPVRTYPWAGSGIRAWSSALEQSLTEATRVALDRIQLLRSRAAALCEAVDAPLSAYSMGRLERLAHVVQAAGSRPLPRACLDAEQWATLAARTEAWRDARVLADDMAAKLALRWTDGLYEIDLAPLTARFERWAYSFFLLAWFFLWGARSRMREIARGALPSNGKISEDLKWAERLVRDRDRIEAARSDLAHALEGSWDGRDASDLDGLLDLGARVRDEVRRVGGADQVPPGALNLLGGTTPDAARGRAKAMAEAVIEALGDCFAATDGAVQLLKIPAEHLPADTSQYLDEMGRLLEHYVEALPQLRAWCNYATLFDTSRKRGLAAFADAHWTGALAAKDIERAVERSVLEGWAMSVRDSEPALRDFDGPNRHRLIDRFRDQDRAHFELGRRKVIEALEERLPTVSDRTSDKSEVGVLRREVEKKTKHMAIRQLFQRIPNLLPRLKPCLLMSPLSVAQYLPAEGKRFDLVVFDEASQICTYDAVGAIARGNQVVVVGDSKQLPPTSFFKRGTEEDAQDENDFTELESVLDEAKAAGLPEQMLTWHYRSRHEALIGFSNDHYYDGKLNVFPAAANRVENLGVHWHQVRNGVYEKGKSRTNPIEAKAVVDFLVERLAATQPGHRTFGIITFSQAQRECVEDLLDRVRGANPKIEAHFSKSLIEPVFVKNLENVQGDERDEILFSVGYGPDQTGKVSMNFTPLNHKGGERRLNVAVTRARRVMRVFSTLTSEHIDLRKTQARGPRDLKDFLAFVARNGANEDIAGASSATSSAFEEEVARHLVACGHRVDRGVGCGQYTLDIAVAHPERPGVYALAVESDGASYAAAHTARDRDRLRHDILAGPQGLGWRMHRIWSTDWWFDRAREIHRLEGAIAEAFAAPPPPEPIFELPPSDLEMVSAGDEGPATPQAGASVAPPAPSIAPRASPLTPYQRATPTFRSGDPDILFNDRYRDWIRIAIAEVVAVEAPLHVDDVCRRVGSAFGVSRLSARMKGRILEMADARSDADIRGEFIWKRDVLRYEGMRGPSEDGEVRHAERLPPEEVANVARWVLSENLSLPRDELLREMARALGLQRAGSVVTERMLDGLRELAEWGGCDIAGETVSYREPDEGVLPPLAVPARSKAPPKPVAHSPQPLTAALARSPLFSQRCKAEVQPRVLAAVELLVQRSGHRSPASALAPVLGCTPGRVRGAVAAISQAINHDGFEVLWHDAVTDQVLLNVDRLRALYGLDGPT